MCYSVWIITVLLLVGCNLGSDAPLLEQTPTPLSDDAPVNDTPITYWDMLPMNEVVPTEDDVVLFDQFILRQVEHDVPRTDSDIINLERSIQGLIESATFWNTDNLTIESLMIDDGLATIRLNGSIRATGGAILSAVPTQFYLTVFDDPNIDRALITTDGENIMNLGISNDSQRQPADAVFTREMLATQLE